MSISSTSVVSDILCLEEQKFWVNNKDAYRAKKEHDEAKTLAQPQGKVKGRKNPDGTYTVYIDGVPHSAKQCNGKLCNGKVRLLKYFHKDSSKQSGYASTCSSCRSERKSYYNMYNPKKTTKRWK